jgi:hypothetical protein
VTSTHWLESSVATGVDSVGLASLEVAAADVDDFTELLPGPDPECVVRQRIR